MSSYSASGYFLDAIEAVKMNNINFLRNSYLDSLVFLSDRIKLFWLIHIIVFFRNPICMCAVVLEKSRIVIVEENFTCAKPTCLIGFESMSLTPYLALKSRVCLMAFPILLGTWVFEHSIILWNLIQVLLLLNYSRVLNHYNADS